VLAAGRSLRCCSSSRSAMESRIGGTDPTLVVFAQTVYLADNEHVMSPWAWGEPVTALGAAAGRLSSRWRSIRGEVERPVSEK
jgi:hypothetical protein